MSDPTGDDAGLRARALEFANELDATLRGVPPDVPPITAVVRTGDAHRSHVHIAPRAADDPSKVATVP